MGTDDQTCTVVLNLMDGREGTFCLSPEMAVIAAYEQLDRNNFDLSILSDPDRHPCFREHRLGFSCGDWIAYRQVN